ncbi:MAG: hypothetical protein CMP61_02115 [Flavobacteriales bacterium]|nr:hypothetical protein [Flavobacteriales bacterium]|tara:strand:- start:4168 stop:6117 length:1950 start_codon:yes stop_codon:yes gene_type:complete
MIRLFLLFLGFFITSVVVSQKLEWEGIPAYKLARPNWDEYKWERRQFDSSLVNVLTKSKRLPAIKGFDFMNPYKCIHQSIGNFSYLPSARYYMPDLNAYTFENTKEVICFGYSSEYTSKFFKPFYFKNQEVSVGEYREFLHYVKDSIIRSHAGEEDPDRYLIDEGEYMSRLNWKKKLPDYRNDINWTWLLDLLYDKVASYKKDDDSIYIFQKDRLVYEGWFVNKKCPDNLYDLSECLERRETNVFPDTLTWIRHFPYSWNEPIAKVYNWHPFYENYPIVGLNYEQVQAFLNWKEKQLNKKYKKRNFTFKLSLPNPIEYEYAVSTSFVKKRFDSRIKENESIFLNAGDKVKFYSLILKDSVCSNRREKINKERNINPYSISAGNFVFDGLMHTGPVDFVSEDYPKLHILTNGIKHLGSNVSEWMDYSFEEYKRYFDCQNTTSSNEGKKWNDDYRMVMGGNWYDEKTTLNYGAPLNSIYSKTFAHKDSAFCTVGFRYVIRIIQKPESESKYMDGINNPVPNVNCFDSLSPAMVKKLPNVFTKLRSLGYKVILDSLIKKNIRQIIFVPQGLEVKTINQNVYYRDSISRIYIRIVPENLRTRRQEEFKRYLKPFVSGDDSFYSITSKSDKLIGLYTYKLFDQGIIILSQRVFN